MPRLPESPRARRRALKIAVAALLVLAGVAVAVLIPSKGPSSGTATTNEGPAQLASRTSVKLTAADRRAIDNALDEFLPAAMERKDMTKAWQLAGPEFRASTTLADWRAGNTPVPRYLAKEKTFDTWQTIDNGPGYVIFNIALHPQQGFDEPPTVFSGEVVKARGAWRVNRLYAVSLEYKITKTTHEVGPGDFGAGAVYHPPAAPKAHNSGLKLIPILVLLSLILLIPISVGIVALTRARRWKKAVRASGATTLPPLPSSYQQTDEERNEILSQS